MIIQWIYLGETQTTNTVQLPTSYSTINYVALGTMGSKGPRNVGTAAIKTYNYTVSQFDSCAEYQQAVYYAQGYFITIGY